jgi:hypothetical protein
MAERACLTLASVFCWAVRAPSRVIAAVEGRGREAMGRGSGVVGRGCVSDLWLCSVGVEGGVLSRSRVGTMVNGEVACETSGCRRPSQKSHRREFGTREQGRSSPSMVLEIPRRRHDGVMRIFSISSRKQYGLSLGRGVGMSLKSTATRDS